MSPTSSIIVGLVFGVIIGVCATLIFMAEYTQREIEWTLVRGGWGYYTNSINGYPVFALKEGPK